MSLMSLSCLLLCNVYLRNKIWLFVYWFLHKRYFVFTNKTASKENTLTYTYWIHLNVIYHKSEGKQKVWKRQADRQSERESAKKYTSSTHNKLSFVWQQRSVDQLDCALFFPTLICVTRFGCVFHCRCGVSFLQFKSNPLTSPLKYDCFLHSHYFWRFFL